MSVLLNVENLKIRYHTRKGILTAIDSASFTLCEREILGLVGESGCGKSTISSALTRLLPPNGEIAGGRILFRGQDLSQLNQYAMRDIRGKDISMVFQDAMTSLNPVFTVEQQMMDAQRAHLPGGKKIGRKALLAKAIDMLDRMGIADASKQIQKYPHQFSGGMRQRIMIAMALLSNPAMLIADEPTSALDVTLEAQIIDLIRGLRDELDTAILYITHDLGVVANLCDRVMVMYAGNIIEEGNVLDIFQNPKHPYTQALLQSHPSHRIRGSRLRTISGRVPSLFELPPGCRFAPRCKYRCSICESQKPQQAMVDRQNVLCHAYHADWQGEMPQVEWEESISTQQRSGTRVINDDIVVETSRLRTYFPDNVGLVDRILDKKRACVRALDGVDVQIRRGETLALVGESGSGKTTFGRTVLRLVDATAGEVILEGEPIARLSQSQVRAMRARMQMIFQEPFASLSPRMRVSSILREPFGIHGIPFNSDTIDGLLEMVGLSGEQADKYPHQLSGGQARRVGIARALALRPNLLVADEPTAGLDVSVAAGILNLLKDLREQLNLTFIIITHNLNVVRFIADRVAVMYLGKIVELSETQDLFAAPKHPYSEALLSAISIPDPTLRNKRQRIVLDGEIPSPRTPPSGCAFHPRCRYAQARCSEEPPSLRFIEDQTRMVACHYPEQVVRSGIV